MSGLHDKARDETYRRVQWGGYKAQDASKFQEAPRFPLITPLFAHRGQYKSELCEVAMPLPSAAVDQSQSDLLRRVIEYIAPGLSKRGGGQPSQERA